MPHIMLDAETLAVTADAAIISIGAVKFELGTGEIDDTGFYASISIESNLQLGRRIREDTLTWWLKQSTAAQQVFHEPKESLQTALVHLSDWIGNGDNCTVWSNGASFDIPMLNHAYCQCELEIPWMFYNERCYRTYKNLPGAERVGFGRQSIAHNAFADAVSQAKHLCAIHRTLFRKEAM
jgi:hypothetical protein